MGEQSFGNRLVGFWVGLVIVTSACSGGSPVASTGAEAIPVTHSISLNNEPLTTVSPELQTYLRLFSIVRQSPDISSAIVSLNGREYEVPIRVTDFLANGFPRTVIVNPNNSDDWMVTIALGADDSINIISIGEIPTVTELTSKES